MYISKSGLLTCLVMMTMSMGFLTSCSDEEDDDKGGGSVTQTESGNFDGSHLIAVSGEYDNTHFNYNADGSLRQIVYYDGTKLTLDYTSGSATFTEDNYEQKAYFKTNQKGYITELRSSGADEDGDWTFIYQFQYNSSDHLTNVAFNQVYTKEEPTNITWELTWNGDLLSSVNVNGVDSEDRWSNSLNFIYADALDNLHMQYTNTVIDYIDLENIEDLMFVGFFGKGPSKYPSKIEESDMDNAPITYELNSKGLVEKESVNYNGNYTDTVDYSYDGL